MKIIDAYWTKYYNQLAIKCDCGKVLLHRADRWSVVCSCGLKSNLKDLRDDYVRMGQNQEVKASST